MRAKSVVDAILGTKVDDLEFGVIIQDCRKLLSGAFNFRLCHVRRTANVVANCLTKHAQYTEDIVIWSQGHDFIHSMLFWMGFKNYILK